MKLSIVSRQSKGLMGGVSFEVMGRAELTPEEQELITYYKLKSSVLLKRRQRTFGGS